MTLLWLALVACLFHVPALCKRPIARNRAYQDAVDRSRFENFARTVGRLQTRESAQHDLSLSLIRKSSQGSVTVVGSGIKGISQFTSEAWETVLTADVVLFLVADPMTKQHILTHRPDAMDLFPLYDEKKVRTRTYSQITELIVAPARAGYSVTAVFYGHPGVFAKPGHDAIALARSANLPAVMLPGISAMDALYADLGVDPAYGSQVLEATDLVIRPQRQLDTFGHVVLFQVGLVGEQDYSFDGFKNGNFPKLISRLLRTYPKEHLVTIYHGAVSPIGKPKITRFALGDLMSMRAEQIKDAISAMDTMYIPPVAALPIDPQAAASVRSPPSANPIPLVEPVADPAAPPPAQHNPAGTIRPSDERINIGEGHSDPSIVSNLAGTRRRDVQEGPASPAKFNPHGTVLTDAVGHKSVAPAPPTCQTSRPVNGSEPSALFVGGEVDIGIVPDIVTDIPEGTEPEVYGPPAVTDIVTDLEDPITELANFVAPVPPGPLHPAGVIEFLTDFPQSPQLREQFQANPDAAMAQYGNFTFDDVQAAIDPSAVHDARLFLFLIVISF